MTPGARVEHWKIREGGSNFSFARAARERWKASIQGEPPLDDKSTDVTIRRWIDGKSDIGKHQELRKAIAEELEVSVDELFPQQRETVDPAKCPMVGFEVLGGFDPQRENPCRHPALELLGGLRAMTPRGLPERHTYDWFKSPQGVALWAVVPPGAGRSFVVHWHRHRDLTPRSEAHSVAKLRDLDITSLMHHRQPLVVEVDSSADDVDVSNALAQRGSVLVLATEPPPGPRVSELDGLHAAAESAWRIARWKPDRAWRTAFVRWVTERAVAADLKSEFDLEKFVDWADQIDPGCNRIATPGDLLPLLAFAHKHCSEEIRRRFGRDLARQVCDELIQQTSSSRVRAEWLSAEGVDAFERTVTAWWRDASIPWGDSLPTSELARCVPVRPSHGDATEEVIRLIQKVAGDDAPKQKRKDLASRALEMLRAFSRPEEAIFALRDARLLRQTGGDRVRPRYWWVAESFAQTEVRRSIMKDPPRTWGRWTIDGERRRVVDEVLVALKVADFEALLRRVMSPAEEHDLGALGALESMFIAAGRRFASGWSPGSATLKDLATLARAQVSMLAPHFSGGVPAPRTRAGVHEPSRGGALFLAACWDWSFTVPSPTDTSVVSPWLFPGWCEPRFDAMPDGLRFHHGHGADPANLAEFEGVARLTFLAPQAIERCAGQPGASDWGWPRFLVPAMVVEGAKKGWSILPWARDVIGPAQLSGEWLAAQLRSLAPPRRTAAVSALWEIALGEGRPLLSGLVSYEPRPEVSLQVYAPHEAGPEYFRVHPEYPISPLTQLLSESFPVDLCAERAATIAATSRWFGALLDLAPLAVRAELVQKLIARGAGQHALLGALAARGREHVDEIIQFTAQKSLWLEATWAVWRIAPEVAQARAEAAYVRGETHPWINGMTVEALDRIVEIAERHPSIPVSEELRLWLSRRLAEGGPLADRVFALLERERHREQVRAGLVLGAHSGSFDPLSA